jgi:hypothetical protein
LKSQYVSELLQFEELAGVNEEPNRLPATTYRCLEKYQQATENAENPMFSMVLCDESHESYESITQSHPYLLLSV